MNQPLRDIIQSMGVEIKDLLGLNLHMTIFSAFHQHNHFHILILQSISFNSSILDILISTRYQCFLSHRLVLQIIN